MIEIEMKIEIENAFADRNRNVSCGHPEADDTRVSTARTDEQETTARVALVHPRLMAETARRPEPGQPSDQGRCSFLVLRAWQLWQSDCTAIGS